MAGETGYLLAVDVGSTTTRCVLFDLQGRPVAEAYREPRTYHPQPTWTEVEPEEWWSAAVEVIREVIQQAGAARERIRAVGLCGLKHALAPVDARGRPLARAMLWMDQRCQPQAAWLAREHGDLIEAIMGGGRGVSTTPSAPKLRWIVEHDPDLLARTHVFLPAKDFVRFRLTGTLGTDPSDAGGTRLYDPRSGDWAGELLARIGVPREKMPPIYASTHVAGPVTPEAAALTGLAPGTPVVVGAGDVQSTLVGANTFGARHACLYLGTAAWMSVARPAAAAAGERVDRPLSAACFGATSTTGAALKWLRQLLQGDAASPAASYGALLQEAAAAPVGARGLIFLPHLMGERGPRDDPQAKGVLFGLTLAHGRGDIARAVLEGCAYQLRRIASGLPLPEKNEMIAVGGGAKSELWLSILADVMGVALLVPRVVEAGALGAAILAGVGVGVYPSVEEAAAALVQIQARVAPDEARRERYEAAYALFLELEERVAPLYGALVPAG
jgi:xylulokinase